MGIFWCHLFAAAGWSDTEAKVQDYVDTYEEVTVYNFLIRLKRKKGLHNGRVVIEKTKEGWFHG